MATAEAPAALAEPDLRADREVAALAQSITFLLDVSPVDAAQRRQAWLAGDHDEPSFTYRPLSTEPAVVLAALEAIDLDGVQHPTVAALLRHKVHELGLQARMLAARGTDAFLPLSLDLFGGVTPALHRTAQALLDAVASEPPTDEPVSAEEFLGVVQDEIAWYREQDAEVVMHAEVRGDVGDVMVNGDTLLIPAGHPMQRNRAQALLQHEVGTHLVTQVNGAVQPLRCMSGLAGYDETQEGLAVLAEVAVGQLTATRLRQLAGRVLTVEAMTSGGGFGDCWQQLVSRGFKRDEAFTTVMRVFRSGGLTKDACYLRGLVALLEHLAAGGSLELFYRGKFALADLPHVERLEADGLLRPARLVPHVLADEGYRQRLLAAAGAPLETLVSAA